MILADKEFAQLLDRRDHRPFVPFHRRFAQALVAGIGDQLDEDVVGAVRVHQEGLAAGDFHVDFSFAVVGSDLVPGTYYDRSCQFDQGCAGKRAVRDLPAIFVTGRLSKRKQARLN